jgi:hypothetical protein
MQAGRLHHNFANERRVQGGSRVMDMATSLLVLP